jgi:hypothetical protein
VASKECFINSSLKKGRHNFLASLWFESDGTDTKLSVYRTNVQHFAAAPSHVCANYGLKYLVKSKEKTYLQASNFVQNNLYVADGLTSVEIENEAI